MMPTATIDRLIELGRQTGGLTVGDVQRVVPIETLTVDEIAILVDRLEDAGIAVAIDPALLTPRGNKAHLIMTPPRERPKEQATAARQPNRASSRHLSRANPDQARPQALGEKSFAGSGTIFVVAATLTLLVLVLVIWSFT